MNAAGSTPPNPPTRARRFALRFKPTPRDKQWLVSLALFVAVTLLVWRPLRYELTMFFVLRADAPSDNVLAQLAAESGDPARALKRMWRSGNLTAREFVLDYLDTRRSTQPALLCQSAAIVNEAARDPDLKVQEPALNILAGHKDPESFALIRGQLSDADPAVRVMALQALQHTANPNDVPAALRLLGDPDPRVVVQAASLLRKVTDFDSGIRISDALPDFTRDEDGTPLSQPNLQAIQCGVERWREWWSSNQTEFSDSPNTPLVTASALPLNDFTLKDLSGRAVRLSDFRGKTVLLWFWKTGDVRCLDDLAALKSLQEQDRPQVAVVGIAYDPTVGPQDECAEEGHEHGQPMMMNGHMMVMDTSLGPVESVVRDAVTQRQIPFPVLLDKKGTAVFRFNVQELPTYVLIDSEGRLCRRFTGSRTLEVFKAMADEAGNLPTAPVATR